MMRRLTIPFFLFVFCGILWPYTSDAVNAQDSLIGSFQSCDGVPCLTIQNATATGPWTGSQNLNDLFLGSFANCSGVPCLTVNGAGGGSGNPGGSNTQVQFNDSDSFGGDAGFTYNKTTDTATIVNLLATTVNKLTLTAPASSATLTIINNKVLTISNTVTLAGTDGSTLTFGTGGTVAYTANKLSTFASTTSAELAGIISDKVGSAGLSFSGISALANPSASIGLTANNGSAITAMRSDATSALDVSIAPTWTGVHTFASTKLKVGGSSSGTVTLAVPAAAGANTLTLPAGTTDFSATGGTSQVVKQTGAGSALTVARLACADLSDSGAGCTGSGGGAPTDAHYVTTQAESGLSAEVSLGALTTGLVLNTVSAAVSTPSTYTGTSCSNQFPRSLSASGAATCATVDLAADVGATIVPVANGGAAWTVHTYINTSASADIYVVVGGGTSNATEANIDVAPIPINMTCRNLRVQLSTAPAGVTTWDVTLRSGAVGSLSATALTCQIAGAATSCADTTHTASLTAGNVWTYLMDATGSVGGTGVYALAMECYK